MHNRNFMIKKETRNYIFAFVFFITAIVFLKGTGAALLDLSEKK